jgi:hypothetical protein
MTDPRHEIGRSGEAAHLWPLAVLCLIAVGCAAGLNAQVGTVNSEGIVAGFWRGLWHGFIAPVTFIISLFSRDVRIYEVHNNGGWYDFGFILGVSGSLGGAIHGPRSKRRVARSSAS